MRILLIPPKSNYPNQLPSDTLLGQGFPYVSAALKQAGHEIRPIDIGYVYCCESAHAFLSRSITRAIDDYEPALICVGGLSADYLFIRDAISICRKHASHIPILCGGLLISFDTEYLFESLHPDFAILGEAEKPIVELADAIQNSSPLEGVSNLIYWKDSKICRTSVSPVNQNLDVLPFPDYSAYDLEGYIQSFEQSPQTIFFTHTRTRPRVFPVSLGRSCPYSCTFCCHHTGAKRQTGQQLHRHDWIDRGDR